MESSIRSISFNHGDTGFRFWSVWLPAAADDVVTQHSHAFYEIHTVRRGTVTFHLSDTTVTVGAGESLIVPPHTLHGTTRDMADRTAVAFSIEKLDGGDRCFYRFKRALDEAALSPFAFADLSNEDLLMHRELYLSFSGKLQLQAAASTFVWRLFTRLCEDADTTAQDDGDIRLLLDEYVYRYETSLDEIAAATNYSKRHLSRLIKQCYGLPLSKLRKQNRKELA